ncbi:hypothetical protein GCM10007415_21870 [Parapedobacter pyrenivorans]|uniref:Outer membrane protein beta-barrel domain-containing protein n=1 Tax=Parapedobacter pyrenivorans TaxID=1305674 RepID=A0A917HS39_9SPHI|nr:hypothetical protein [Parapedobacter pyrenivorans]GGG87659.1 hypothetical protein GCM10007415_21870 [Parapedobacter pyrenivorans]
MDKRPKKELINGIKDFLKDFEEPYDHGEWKRFQRQRKNRQRKPIPLFIKLAGVAASLFLMVYASVRFLPFFDRKDEIGGKVPKAVPYCIGDREQQTKDTASVGAIPPLVDGDDQMREMPEAIMPAQRLPDFNRELQTQPSSVTANTTGIMLDSIPKAQAIKNVGLQAGHFGADLPRHGDPAQTKPARSNWINLRDTRIGFNINPAFTNKGFSFGGGIAAQIPLFSRISTEIGVSYTNLRVGVDMAPDMTDTVRRQLIGIRHSVGMVAIPVSLNFLVTKNFSASLGLVPFRVVRDQRTDILQSFRWVKGDVLSGDTTSHLVGERTTSKRSDSLYMGKTYLGFVHIAGQLSPPILKRYNMVITPFVAIPLEGLSKEKYRWLHGGVSFRIYLR